MPIVSTKRQITLPVDQCREAGIEPGDEFESYVANDGQITIVKKASGAAHGVLKYLTPDSSLSDEESLQSAIQE